MKKLIFLFIIAFSLTLLSVTACAAAPEVQEGTSAVTVTNIADGDFAILLPESSKGRVQRNGKYDRGADQIAA